MVQKRDIQGTNKKSEFETAMKTVRVQKCCLKLIFLVIRGSTLRLF